MNWNRILMAIAALSGLVASPVGHACMIGDMRMGTDRNGNPVIYHMILNPNGSGKCWSTGVDCGDGIPRPGGAVGPGIPIGTIPGFGTNVNFALKANSNSLTSLPNGDTTIGFVPASGIVTSDGVNITLPSLTGGWTYVLHESGTTETFTTGLFSFSGTGTGSDGNLYQVAFSAAGSSGTFADPILTLGTVGDPTIGVVHPQSILYTSVTASVTRLGALSIESSVSLSSLSTACQTDCILVIGSSVPEPSSVIMTGIGLASVFGFTSLRTRHRRSRSPR